MFTMDDWLGLVMLMAAIVTVIALVAMFTKGCVGVVRWHKRKLSETDIAAAKVLADAIGKLPIKVVRNDNWPHLQPGFDPRPRDEQVAMIQALADGRLGMHIPLLPTHTTKTPPLTCDEIKALLPTIGDMAIGYRPSYGIDMGAGDDITTRKFSESEICEYFGVPLSLDSIIRDLRETIVLEHLEVRSTTRFNNILKRLEAYRDSDLPVPPQ